MGEVMPLETTSIAPLRIEIELLRGQSTRSLHGNPNGFSEPIEYLRRFGDGSVAYAAFPWRDAVQEDLAAIALEKVDLVAVSRMGDELAAFLDQLGFSRDRLAITEALAQQRHVHITLRFGAEELCRLPWELVPVAGIPLAAHRDVVLQYEWPQSATVTAETQPSAGGRVVFAWSAAGGDVPHDEHLAAIRDAYVRGHLDFDERRDVLADASLQTLRLALEQAPTAILHLLCHGGVVASRASAYGLVLSRDDGAFEPDIIDAAVLRDMLADHARSLRFVVLAACHAARVDLGQGRLGSVAEEIARAGIPAVLSSRYPLSKSGSIAMAETLYSSLLIGKTSLPSAFENVKERLRHDKPTGSDYFSLVYYSGVAGRRDPRPLVFRPYRGFQAFQMSDSDFFFGREEETNIALDRLVRLIDKRDRTAARIFMVLSASGGGSSSFVFASLLPRFAEVCPGLHIVPLRWPDADPTAWLTREVALHAQSGKPCLLVLDAFEDLLLRIKDAPLRQQLVRTLWQAASNPTSDLSILLTLRSYEVRRIGDVHISDDNSTLADVAARDEHRIVLAPLSPDKLREAMVKPLHKVGLSADYGLIEQILMDAGDEPGALPLVQCVLDALWVKRVSTEGGDRLTFATYHALGGVGGAITGNVTSLLGALDERRQCMARRLFRQFVEAHADGTIAVRRHLLLDDLHAGPPADAEVFHDVLRVLAAMRVVVLDATNDLQTPVVALAHRQLVQRSELLRAWLETDRAMQMDLDTLRTWIGDAQRFARPLDGGQLDHAAALEQRYGDDIPFDQRRFLEESRRIAITRTRREVLVRGVVPLLALLVGAMVAIGLSWVFRR